MRNDPFLDPGVSDPQYGDKLTKHALKSADLDSIKIEVGEHGYFRLLDLAIKFRIPVKHFYKWLKNHAYGGRKIGRHFIISEDEFKQFVISGGMDNFHRRPGRNKNVDHKELAVKEAQKQVDVAEKEFNAWQRQRDD